MKNSRYLRREYDLAKLKGGVRGKYYRQATAMSNLNPSPKCLLVFIDETGHEEFADPKYPLFGYGGCACLASSYEEVIRTPWRGLKERHFGGSEVGLHASEVGKPGEEQIEALAEFFLSQPFYRFYAIAKTTTTINGVLDPYHLVAGSMLKQVTKIASRCVLDSIAMIFEQTDRLDLPAARFFSAYEFSYDDGTVVPVEWRRMSKSLHEPGLEVADFVLHVAGSQTRDRLKGRTRWRKDFDSVFHNIDQNLVSGIEIDEVTPTEAQEKKS